MEKLRRDLSKLRESLPSGGGYCSCPPVIIERVTDIDGTVTPPEFDLPEVCPQCGKPYDDVNVSFILVDLQVVPGREEGPSQ
jgi:hypothetical protein